MAEVKEEMLKNMSELLVCQYCHLLVIYNITGLMLILFKNIGIMRDVLMGYICCLTPAGYREKILKIRKNISHKHEE